MAAILAGNLPRGVMGRQGQVRAETRGRIRGVAAPHSLTIGPPFVSKQGAVLSGYPKGESSFVLWSNYRSFPVLQFACLREFENPFVERNNFCRFICYI